MKNLFSVIVIIAVSILIFIAYYAGKNLYLRYEQKRIKSKIQKKRYEDEKKYIHFYIRSLLKDLKTGTLRWILIFSRINPEVKIELIYNSVINMMQIQHRIRKLSTTEIANLKNLGLQSYEAKNDLNCFYVSHNSKIVTDVIYFILEEVGQQKRAQNIKVITSGG